MPDRDRAEALLRTQGAIGHKERNKKKPGKKPGFYDNSGFDAKIYSRNPVSGFDAKI